MKRTVHWFGRGAGFSVCALALAASAGAQTLRTNLALSTNGGSVERITDQAVPGPVGNRLIDGNSETVWQASAAKTPHEIVLSFFNRQSALVSGVRLVTTGTKDRQPSRVEVWVSRDGANGIFSRVVEAALKDDAVQPELAFKPINATFVKVVIAETRSGGPAELAEVEVLEASTPGYKAMAVRHPAMRDWSQRPRYIAQRGVDWLESAALDWQRQQSASAATSRAR